MQQGVQESLLGFACAARRPEAQDLQIGRGYSPAVWPPRSPSFGRILALTFTNKAAQEMKDRVVEELEVLAEDAAASDHASGRQKRPAWTLMSLAAAPGRCARREPALWRTVHHDLDKFVGGLVLGFATDLQLSMTSH